jgi:hypothetical protein
VAGVRLASVVDGRLDRRRLLLRLLMPATPLCRPNRPTLGRRQAPPWLQKEHCVVIVGAGFAGFNAARELSRLAGATTEIVLVNSTDYFLYLPLMPQVTGGADRAATHLLLAIGSAARDPLRARDGAARRPPAEDGQLGWPRRHVASRSL